jgi:hypothetical protein
MSRKKPARPERTERRRSERAARSIVQDREKLAALSPGGSADRPITVAAAPVIEIQIRSMPCIQCEEGRYKVQEHRSAGAGLRDVSVVCQLCGAPRLLWFRIVPDEPN